MADVSKLNLYGDVYNIKDATARQNAQDAASSAETAQQTANTAKNTADLALTGANKITYSSEDETVTFTKVSGGE